MTEVRADPDEHDTWPAEGAAGRHRARRLKPSLAVVLVEVHRSPCSAPPAPSASSRTHRFAGFYVRVDDDHLGRSYCLTRLKRPPRHLAPMDLMRGNTVTARSILMLSQIKELRGRQASAVTILRRGLRGNRKLSGRTAMDAIAPVTGCHPRGALAGRRPDAPSSGNIEPEGFLRAVQDVTFVLSRFRSRRCRRAALCSRPSSLQG
jgi:hypothetical protein